MTELERWRHLGKMAFGDALDKSFGFSILCGYMKQKENIGN
jgi:hypothetical protein